LSDWTVAKEQVATYQCGGGGACTAQAPKGYFTYDATNVYVGLDFQGVNTPPNSGNWLGIYFGNGAGGGATIDLPVFKGAININRTIAAGAGIQYGFEWQSTSGTGTPSWFTWNNGGGSWTAGTFPAAGVVGYSSANNTVEFSIPLAAIGATSGSTVAMFAAVVGPLPGTINELFRFPAAVATGGSTNNSNYGYVFLDSLASCSAPNVQFKSY